MSPTANADDRLPLNKVRLIDAAVAFADERGLDGLSMRSLARELGFGVMSLYTHVANKDQMLDAMVERVAGEIETPSSDRPWREAINISAGSAHRALLRHPWAVDQWPKRQPGPARLHYMESILASLASADLSSAVVYHGYHAITTHVVGFTQQELSYQQILGEGDLTSLVSGFLDSGAVDTLPHLARHARAHLDQTHTDDEFGFILDLILDGLGRADDPVD